MAANITQYLYFVWKRKIVLGICLASTKNRSGVVKIQHNTECFNPKTLFSKTYSLHTDQSKWQKGNEGHPTADLPAEPTDENTAWAKGSPWGVCRSLRPALDFTTHGLEETLEKSEILIYGINCRGNVQLGKYYFDLLIRQHISVVVVATSNVAAQYGETGKTSWV